MQILIILKIVFLIENRSCVATSWINITAIGSDFDVISRSVKLFAVKEIISCNRLFSTMHRSSWISGRFQSSYKRALGEGFRFHVEGAIG